MTTTLDITIPAPRPRPHQEVALHALAQTFQRAERAQLVMACGTGKTLVARWHAQAAGAGTVLVLLPSLALVAQTLKEWRSAPGWSFEGLVVCSDPTTADGTAEREDGDVGHEVWAHEQVRVTTNHRAVSGFLRRRRTTDARVIFATYHSAPVVLTAQRSTARDPGGRAELDLIVLDEAHRLAGRPRAEFRSVLDAGGLRAHRRLFMTATRRVVDSSDPDVLSMDDEQQFGPVAHALSFGEAIAAGLLSDYRVMVAGQTSRRHPAAPGSRPDPVQSGERVGISLAALADAADRHGVRRMLSFHGRVAKAEAFARDADHLVTPGGIVIRARCVSAASSAAERAAALRWLGAGDADPRELRLVSSARCLSEGVDVPSVDGVLFAEPRTSGIDTVQAVGRALRPAPGKTHGTVILPLELPDDVDDETWLSVSSWEPVWSVLRALREMDNRFDTQVRDAVVREVQTGNRRPWQPANLEFLLPQTRPLPEVQLRLVQQLGTEWERLHALAQEWFAEHPGARMPRTLMWRERYLGEWAEKQRVLHRRGHLAAERAHRLETLAGWVWDRGDAEWLDTLRILRDVAESTGLDEPQRTTDAYEGHRSATRPRMLLGTWVAQQRNAWREGQLPPERAAQLEALPGWRWSVLPARDIAMVDSLRIFVEFEKHADVPADHLDDDGQRLGAWIWDVRRRRLLGQLHPSLLSEILAATPNKWSAAGGAFSWEAAETQWRLAYTALLRYLEREGNASPRTGHKESLLGTTINLHQWIALQRHHRRRGDLSAEHEAALERVPGWRWAGAGVARPFGPPLDLEGHRHGTAKGISAGCPCEECLTARRQNDRDRLERLRQVADPVPAQAARAHLLQLLEQLQQVGGKDRGYRSVIAAAARVPLATVRTALDGAEQLERPHAEALLQLQLQAVTALITVGGGSRGRAVSSRDERIPAGPTHATLGKLAAHGFGPQWISRELGFKVTVRGDRVTRRVAEAIAELDQRVGALQWHGPAQRSAPPLAELLEQQARAARGQTRERVA